MAVFMDSGGGDIYGAETKEECLAAIAEDCPDFENSNAFEVCGESKARLLNEDDSPGEMVTLREVYSNIGYGYLVASTNC